MFVELEDAVMLIEVKPVGSLHDLPSAARRKPLRGFVGQLWLARRFRLRLRGSDRDKTRACDRSLRGLPEAEFVKIREFAMSDGRAERDRDSAQIEGRVQSPGGCPSRPARHRGEREHYGCGRLTLYARDTRPRPQHRVVTIHCTGLHLIAW